MVRTNGYIDALGGVVLLSCVPLDEDQEVTAFPAVEHFAKIIGQTDAVVQRVCRISGSHCCVCNHK